MDRYERHTEDACGVLRIQELTLSEVKTLRFQDKQERMVSAAYDEITSMVEAAKLKIPLTKRRKPDYASLLAQLGRQQQAATQGFSQRGLGNMFGNPHLNGQAAQQVPMQYQSMLGLRSW